MVTTNYHCFSCQSFQCSFTFFPPKYLSFGCMSEWKNQIHRVFLHLYAAQRPQLYFPSKWLVISAQVQQHQKHSASAVTHLRTPHCLCRLPRAARKKAPKILQDRRKKCRISMFRTLRHQLLQKDGWYFAQLSLSYCTNMTDIAQVCLFNTFWQKLA